MNIHGRIKELVGHTISLRGHSSTTGILEEVGEDFLVISPIYYTPEHPEELESRLFIKISQITSIVHEHDCEKCELESSVQSVA